MKLIIIAALTLVACGYPFMVLFGLQHFGPGMLALLLLIILLLRTYLLKSTMDKQVISLLIIVAIYCLGVALTDNEAMLRCYPVLMSLGMAWVFFKSLSANETMIEKFARLSGASITKTIKHYTRNVTKIWIAALIFNALIALYTVFFSSLEMWSYYNGFVSYVLFGILMLSEYVFRGYYKKRNQVNDAE